MRLNLAKCEVWSEDEAALGDFPAEITRCKPEGFELLGVGIGSQALCEKILDKRVSKIAESLAMMTVVDDPQSSASCDAVLATLALRSPSDPPPRRSSEQPLASSTNSWRKPPRKDSILGLTSEN